MSTKVRIMKAEARLPANSKGGGGKMNRDLDNYRYHAKSDSGNCFLSVSGP